MSSILIAKISFPNDPTGKLIAHQMFIADFNTTHIDVYSVSSTLGKERRILNDDGTVKDDYFLIEGYNQSSNGFKVPSFIDCTKCYRIQIDSSINISNLSMRNLNSSTVSEILDKIRINEPRQTMWVINAVDFKSWNQRL